MATKAGATLDRLKALIRRPGAGLRPQAFEILCRCGQTLRGERAETSEVRSCPSCGEAILVLARNPLPCPKPVNGRPTLVEVESAPQPPPMAVNGAGDLVSMRRGEFRRRIAGRVRGWLPSRKTFSLPRIAAAGVCLLVVLTIGWSWRNRQLTNYAEQLESATIAGRKALEAADFATAVRELETAANAARGLGGNTRRERTARQLNHEAAIWARLLPDSLEDFFSSIGRPRSGPDLKQQQESFAKVCSGRFVVIDSWVSRESHWVEPTPIPGPSPRKQASPVTTVRLDWMLGGPEWRVTLSLDDVTAFDWVPLDSAQHVVFGAELAGIEPDAEDADAWKLRIVPASCTLLTVEGPLHFFGWAKTNELAQLLDSQRDRLGIEP